MSVIDSLLSRMSFNDDDDIDEGYDDIDEGYDDMDDGAPAPARPSRLAFPAPRRRPQQEDDYEAPRPSGRTPLAGNSGRGQANSVIPSGNRRAGSGNMQVRIIKPNTFDQAKQVTETLLSHRTVLLNLEGLDVNTAQRIVDFASGSCYALHGNFMKISHFIIVITPEDVDIAGDISGDSTTDSVLGALAGSAMQQDGSGFGGGFTQPMANPYMQQ